MDPRTLNYFVQAAGGALTGGPDTGQVNRVCSDSRQIRPGDLFVAIRGDRYDGHAFVADALRAGAVAAVVDSGFAGPVPAGAALVRVPDPRLALGRMAACFRRDFQLPVIAVAGSNGKTSTKELLASVLRQRFPVLASEASFNNDIGVPLTLLGLEAEHRAAVLEIGTNHPGELEPLIRLIQPQLGVLTSIGREHLEFFGNLEGVIAEEGVLAEQLPAAGILFLNGDSPGADEIACRTRATVITAGAGVTNRWRARAIRFTGNGYMFTVEGPADSITGEYEIQLLGRPQVMNALLAVAVAASLGLDREQIAAGLLACRPARMRMELFRLGGIQLLNDAYNANADSTRVAFETLAELPVSGRRIAVLGDMAELGPHAPGGHEEMGRLAARLNIETLFAIGKQAPVTVAAAREAGLKNTETVVDLEQLASRLKGELRSGDALLLKASRTTGLERLVDLLRPALVPGE